MSARRAVFEGVHVTRFSNRIIQAVLRCLLHSTFHTHSTSQAHKIPGCTSATQPQQTGSAVVPDPGNTSPSKYSWMDGFTQPQCWRLRFASFNTSSQQWEAGELKEDKVDSDGEQGHTLCF